jgi:cytochrome c oxidase subunit IV
MQHEIVPTRVYFSIFAALLVLTGTTIGVTFFELGRFNLIIALVIAFTKATLVVFFFMHVRQSSALTKIFVVAGLFWFAILIALTFSDYLSRNWLPIPQAW